MEGRSGGDLQELGLEACTDTGDVLTGGYAEGRSGLELVGLRELPAAESFVGETVAAVERKTVDRVDGEHLTDIVVCVAAQTFGVEEVRQEIFLEGTAVLRVSEGVGNAEAEVAAVAVVHVDLQSLIEGGVSLVDLGDRGIAGEGPMRVDSVSAELLCGSEGRLVEVALKLLVQRVTTDVGDVGDGIKTKVALYRDVPGVGFGLRRRLADRAGELRVGAGGTGGSAWVVDAAG